MGSALAGRSHVLWFTTVNVRANQIRSLVGERQVPVRAVPVAGLAGVQQGEAICRRRTPTRRYLGVEVCRA